MSAPGPLFIGVGSHVVAIERFSGREIWRCKLKSSSFVTIHTDGSGLYAGAGGELFCLDPATGQIRWRNKLAGLGMGVIAFDSESSPSVIAAVMAAQAAAAAAAAG
jgi:outer membrane protein assembly factor BamB